MKLLRARIENFKGIKELDLDFRDEEGKPRPLVALIGDNGSGKTTVLQAIALTLELATRTIANAGEFQWPGFLLERIGTLGRSLIQIDIEFDEDELDSIVDVYNIWEKSGSPSHYIALQHGDTKKKNVSLFYKDGNVRSVNGNSSELLQFPGRYYYDSIIKDNPWAAHYQSSLGKLFWFDQSRHMGEIDADTAATLNKPNMLVIEQYRKNIMKWWMYRTSPYFNKPKDYINELQQHFQRVFPDVILAGPAERLGKLKDKEEAEPLFLLKKGDKLYDLAEMSSGEQAVFPLVMEFVRQNIANSIVLIDELELHLHPPQQRLLLQALRKIGPDCQFIFTTHSSWLEGVLAVEEIIRLPGGRLCL